MTLDKKHDLSENSDQKSEAGNINSSVQDEQMQKSLASVVPSPTTNTAHRGMSEHDSIEHTPDIHDSQREEDCRGASVACNICNEQTHPKRAQTVTNSGTLENAEQFKNLQEQLKKLTEKLEESRQIERDLERQSKKLDVESRKMDNQINCAIQSLSANTGSRYWYVPREIRGHRLRARLNAVAGFAQNLDMGSLVILLIALCVYLWWYM